MAEQYQDIDTTQEIIPFQNVADYLLSIMREGIIFTNIALKNGQILEHVTPLKMLYFEKGYNSTYQLIMAQKIDQRYTFISVNVDTIKGLEVIPSKGKQSYLYFHYFRKEGTFETPVRNVRPTGNIFIGVHPEYNVNLACSPLAPGTEETVYEGNALYMEVVDLDDGQLKYFPLWRIIGILANWNSTLANALERQERTVKDGFGAYI